MAKVANRIQNDSISLYSVEIKIGQYTSFPPKILIWPERCLFPFFFFLLFSIFSVLDWYQAFFVSTIGFLFMGENGQVKRDSWVPSTKSSFLPLYPAFSLSRAGCSCRPNNGNKTSSKRSLGNGLTVREKSSPWSYEITLYRPTTDPNRLNRETNLFSCCYFPLLRAIGGWRQVDVVLINPSPQQKVRS